MPRLSASVSIVAGVGAIIDPSSDKEDLEAGTELKLPLWMVNAMTPRGMLRVDLPVFYGSKIRRKMRAGAGCEDLRHRCPHYYQVAIQLHEAMRFSRTLDEQFPAFMLSTFRNRYKVRANSKVVAAWRI